jgi:hypothetical protein
MNTMHNYYIKDGTETMTIDGSVRDKTFYEKPAKQIADLDDKLLYGVRLKKCILGE